ncbi:MAG: dipeptidase [Flavobacteriales bacterium]|nr:dipeptidase [Flavobacteriales bacterium]
MEQTNNYIDSNKDKFLQELIELLKIPSISADPMYAQNLLDCADAIAKNLVESGIENVEVLETKGYPVVYGEKIIDNSLPTILIYGHYDVQPPDPINLWESDPFEPTIKNTEIHPDGALFARGSADDKGQFFMHVKAVEAMINTNSLYCNVKFLIEGEEEVGSENLEDFLIEHKDKLKNDIILISDTSVLSMENPTLTTGLRGLSYLEVEVEGANRDLHSGLYGGAVPNPINILCDMIASLHDKNENVTVKDFYDKVSAITSEELKEMQKLPFDLEEYKNAIGLNDITGERGYSTLERTTIRPSLDVNGIWGGYMGEGAKTVIPSKAYAKISMRLVPNQNPNEITKLFSEHFKSIAPASIKVNVKAFHGGKPYVLPCTDKGYISAKKAMEKTFEKEVLPLRGGGSIPIVSTFEEILGTKSVLMGFGLDSDALHSPNEHFGLKNFYLGIKTIPYFFKYYSESN